MPEVADLASFRAVSAPWVPVSSIRAIRSAPGKLRSRTQIRSLVNTPGYRVIMVSSSVCSPSASGPPDRPETTARVAWVEASPASRSRTCG